MEKQTLGLNYIDKPEFDRVLARSSSDGLSSVSTDTVQLFADMCRLNTLYMIKRAGSGHIGSSLSAMDLVSWIYLKELSRDHSAGESLYFSSKGHDAPGLYSVLCALGLLDFSKIHQLRRLGGLPGHPDVHLPYMHVNSGSLGMGISKAKGFAMAERLAGCKGRYFVLTGDGELQEGQIWESLRGAASHKMGELTVVVDHNKMQSDTWVRDVSDLGAIADRFASHGWQVCQIEGHNYTEIEETFSKLREIRDQPKVVIAHTTKGRGVSFMESVAMTGDHARLYPYHSGAPSDRDYLAGTQEIRDRLADRLKPLRLEALDYSEFELEPKKPAPAAKSLVASYSESLLKHAKQNDKLVCLDGDLALDTGLIPFEKSYPERFFECGIAEQDMVSMAGGLALRGYLPIVHSFACFLSTRPNEQIYTNATEHSKVIYVGSLAGLVPGGPGHSHQSVRDISALAGVPGLVLCEPATEAELSHLMDFACQKTEESVYLRLVSIPVPLEVDLPEIEPPKLGQGNIVRQGSDLGIICYGPIGLKAAYETAEFLEQRDLSTRIILFPWLNRVDDDWLIDQTSDLKALVSIDNHYKKGGLGEMIGATLATHPNSPLHFAFGVEKVPVCGTNEQVLEHHGLRGDLLGEKVMSFLKANVL